MVFRYIISRNEKAVSGMINYFRLLDHLLSLLVVHRVANRNCFSGNRLPPLSYVLYNYLLLVFLSLKRTNYMLKQKVVLIFSLVYYSISVERIIVSSLKHL